MSQQADHIAALHAPTVSALGLELLGVEFRAGSGVLRVYIDVPAAGSSDVPAAESAERAVNVDDCERVSREVSALLDVVKAGILFMDPDHRVVYCNRAFHEIWGVPVSKTLVGSFDGYAPKVSAETISLGERSLKAGKHKLSFRVTGKNKKSRAMFFGVDYLRIGGKALDFE